jgi:prepilin-type N-terminal cleavage/methylation domain-containing protein
MNLSARQVDSQSGMTLIELLVVITIMGIMATLAVVNIRGYMNYARVNQTQRLITSAIIQVRAFIMRSSLNTRDADLWNSTDGKPTHLASGIYFFKGWVKPDDPTDSSGSWADGSGTEFATSYSMLIVTNPGFSTKYIKVAPETSLSSGIPANLQAISDAEVRSRIINLPEGVQLRFANASDSDTVAAGDAIPSVNYFTWDPYGFVVKSNDTDYTSPSFDGYECYLSLSYGDLGKDPIYIDLRSGDLVKNVANIATLNFGSFN